MIGVRCIYVRLSSTCYRWSRRCLCTSKWIRLLCILNCRLLSICNIRIRLLITVNNWSLTLSCICKRGSSLSCICKRTSILVSKWTLSSCWMTICKRRLFIPYIRFLLVYRVSICRWLSMLIDNWSLTLSCICDWLSMLIRKWCLSLSCICTRCPKVIRRR